MNITKQKVERIVRQAQKVWGLNDWTIEWGFGKCEWEGDVELRYTEKYAFVTLDKSKIPDPLILKRTIYHELAHCITAIIERNLSDFADHYIKDKQARDVFYERLNTDQNVLIDHLIVQVLGL